MKNREEILEKVQKIVAKELQCAIELVKENSSLFYDLGMDSLDEVEIIMKLEEVFSLNITDIEFEENCKTVGQVVDFIIEKL